MKLTVQSEATTNMSPEAVFDALCGPPGLNWLETPWRLRPTNGLRDGEMLIWEAGRDQAATRVELHRPKLIRWSGTGLEGVITIDTEGRMTAVRVTARFRQPAAGLVDVVFGLFMRGRISTLASQESTDGLKEFLARRAASPSIAEDSSASGP